METGLNWEDRSGNNPQLASAHPVCAPLGGGYGSPIKARKVCSRARLMVVGSSWTRAESTADRRKRASQKPDRMVKWRGPGCRINTDGRSSQRPGWPWAIRARLPPLPGLLVQVDVGHDHASAPPWVNARHPATGLGLHHKRLQGAGLAA